MSHPSLKSLIVEADETLDGQARIEVLNKLLAEERQWWDLWLKTGGLAATVTAALVASAGLIQQFWIYNDQRSKDAEARKSEVVLRQKEFSLKFYEAQLSAYLELCDFVSSIPIKEPTKDHVTKLRSLIMGKIMPLGDKTVIDNACDLHDELARPLNLPALPFAREKASLIRERLFGRELLLERVIAACKSSLIKTFPDMGLAKPESPLRGFY